MFILGLIGDCLDIIWWITFTTHWPEWQAANDSGTPPDLTLTLIVIAVFGVMSVYVTITGYKIMREK
jgi:hypothetical protein